MSDPANGSPTPSDKPDFLVERVLHTVQCCRRFEDTKDFHIDFQEMSELLSLLETSAAEITRLRSLDTNEQSKPAVSGVIPSVREIEGRVGVTLSGHEQVYNCEEWSLIAWQIIDVTRQVRKKAISSPGGFNGFLEGVETNCEG